MSSPRPDLGRSELEHLNSILERAFDVGDLEAHVALLIVSDPQQPWDGPRARLVAHAAPIELGRSRAQDAALLGVRVALGMQAAPPGFADAMRREMARRPLPPAASAHDDERILLGVAAGIGTAAPELAGELERFASARASGAPPRTALVDSWAASIAGAASSAVRIAGAVLASQPGNDADRVARFFVGTRVFAMLSEVKTREALADIVAQDADALRSFVRRLPDLSPLDAAMLLYSFNGVRAGDAPADGDADRGSSVPSGPRKRVVVLTALADEDTAVREHLSDVVAERHDRGTVYGRGRFAGAHHEWDVLVAEVGEGNDAAALETERAVTHFQPDLVVFVGVAGGIKDVKLGDVVVAEYVYGYESGKDTDAGLAARAKSPPASYPLVQIAREVRRSSAWHGRIQSDAANGAAPDVLIKPIAAGEKVVASTRSQTFKYLRKNHSDAVAVDMEGRGLMRAAHASGVGAVVIRGISDLIDGKAGVDATGWQLRASRIASALAFEMLYQLKCGAGSLLPE